MSLFVNNPQTMLRHFSKSQNKPANLKPNGSADSPVSLSCSPLLRSLPLRCRPLH